MAAGDIYQMSVFYDVLGNGMINTYYYRQLTEETLVAPIARSLWLSFRSEVVTDIREVQSSVTDLVRVYTVNLFDPGDFHDTTPNGADLSGTRSASVMPTFVAYAFRSNRVTRAIRRGQKRIGGMAEEDVAGDAAPPGIEAALATVGVALGRTISGGFPGSAADASWQPVVVKRIPFLDDEGRQQYRLPTDIGEAEYFHASQWSYQRVTTQTTRLLGRGI